MAANVVGTVAVVDLEAACALYGHDSLPSPLGRSRPVGSVWLLSRGGAPIERRLDDGDLRDVRTWLASLAQAEVTVECRVRFSDVATPDIRVHGVRAAESGFVAVQRLDGDGVDVVDIHRVSPHALGAVFADAVGLAGAGSRLRIAVTGRGNELPAAPESIEQYDDFGFLIPSAEPRDTALDVVDGADVVAVATLQTWQNPDRHRGGDANSHVLQWIQVDDDGDYLYAPGGVGYAEPMDVELLRTGIEELIGG